MTSSKFHTSDGILDSIESLEHLHRGNRQIIYWILLFTSAAAVASLWLVKVDISVGAPGQIRPVIERLNVVPAVAGKIVDLKVFDNQSVHRGDILLVTDSTTVDARLTQNQTQMQENQRSLDDLGVLLADITNATSAGVCSDDKFANFFSPGSAHSLPERLRTSTYVRQYAVLVSDIQKLLLQRCKAASDMGRSEALHKRGLLSDVDYDQQHYAVESIDRELTSTVQQTLSRWQSDKIERELKKSDLESEGKQLVEQKGLYTIRAPIDGTALGFSGLQPGLYLPADRPIGEISPDGGLQADVYIGMRDIGFVSTGQMTNLQVETFPYTEWGMIKGRVRQISQDFVQVGQQVVFRAVIDLDRTQLRSSTGVVVELRRGMTVNARIVLKKRTLYNLLYSSLSESLDPQAKPIME